MKSILNRRSWPWLVGVIGLLAGVVMAFVVPQARGDGWSADAKAAESVAESFVVTCYTVDPSDQEATAEALKGIVTDEVSSTCLDLLAPSEEEKSALATAEITFGDPVVSSKGTTQIDGDTANVVVTFSFTATSPQAQSPVPLASRGIVQLVKSGQEWRVSDFTEIEQSEATIADEGADDGEVVNP